MSEFEMHEWESGAVRHVKDKIRIDLVPPEMILSLATVLTYGSIKYSDRNWEKGFPHMSVYASTMRHLMEWAEGDNVDEESGLQHIEQAMCNLGMIATQMRRHRYDLDDRPPIHSAQPNAALKKAHERYSEFANRESTNEENEDED